MSIEPVEPETHSKESSTQTVPWWGRIGLLWLLLVPLCVGAQTLLLPIGPNDFWYHARAGRFIVEHGFIPRENLFTSSEPWVSPATPFHYQSWISEILFFLMLRGGGLSAIIWARSACTMLAFGFLAVAAWQRACLVSEHFSQASARLVNWDFAAKVACGGGLWALAMGNNNFDTRPQMFSVPLFALWSLGLWRWRFTAPNLRLKYLPALWLLLALWVDVHGAFSMAILTTGAYALGATIDAMRQKKPHQDALRLARDSWILLAGCLIAVCLNPRGIEIFSYVNHLATLQSGQKYIQEWQAPEFSLAEWNSLVFYLSPLALAALLLLARRKSTSSSTWDAVSGAEWMVALLLLAMALRDKRSILWFGFWFAPLWASLWTSLPITSTCKATSAPRSIQIVNATLALLLCASLLLGAPNIKASFSWPTAFRDRFAPTPSGDFPRGFANDPALLLDRSTPVEAVSWLLKNPPRARVWHDMAFGSYMMWAADGVIVPMCDPRVELYPDVFWDDYARLSRGARNAPQVLAARGFSDALLDRKLQAPLVRRLLATGQWKVVHTSTPAVLLRQISR